jgi:hypothetical protein
MMNSCQSSAQTPHPSPNNKEPISSLTSTSVINKTSNFINQTSSKEIPEAKKESADSRQKRYRFNFALLKGDESNQQPTILGHSLIILTLLAILIGAYLYEERVAIYRANTWLSDWKKHSNNSLNYPEFLQQNSDNISSFSAAELQRIYQQLQEIQSRIYIHEQIMKSFYRRYYITTSITMGSAILAGICLFIITREGWKQVNKGWITIFLFVSITALLFREVPPIFLYEENWVQNFRQYREYVALRNKIYSFMATGTVLTETPQNTKQFDHPDATQFILLIDQRLAQLHEIHIGFDQARLNSLGNSPLLDIPEE